MGLQKLLKLSWVSSLAVALFLALAGAARVRAQGRIQGEVLDGTSKKRVARQKVILLMPREGMQEVAVAETNANGHFLFDAQGIDARGFYLLQANFQGVSYHAPVVFDADGKASASVTVYDAVSSAPALRVSSARILASAQGRTVRVEEVFAVQNQTRPPRTYANSHGTFRFRVAPGATPRAAVLGMMNMPLPQTPEAGATPGEFLLRYPLKPGLTAIAVAYEADYVGDQFELHDSVPYPIDRAELDVMPAELEVASTSFKASGRDAESGAQRFVADNLKDGAALEARLAGEPAAPSSSRNGTREEQVQSLANSMTRLGVPLLFCFLLLLLWALAIGAGKEWRGWQERRAAGAAGKHLGTQAEGLLNSIADLDELFASSKIPEKKYWKERLELKAKLAALVRKNPSWLLDSYASRQQPR